MSLPSVDLSSLVKHAVQGSTLPLGVRSDRKYTPAEKRLNPEWLETYWKTDLPYSTTLYGLQCYLEEKGHDYKPSATLARLKSLRSVAAEACSYTILSITTTSERLRKTVVLISRYAVEPRRRSSSGA